MNKKLFKQLVESVNEAGAVMRHVMFEVYQGGLRVAASTDAAEALRYAHLYASDGEPSTVRIKGGTKKQKDEAFSLLTAHIPPLNLK